MKSGDKPIYYIGFIILSLFKKSNPLSSAMDEMLRDYAITRTDQGHGGDI